MMERIKKTELAEQWFSVLHSALGQLQKARLAVGMPPAFLAARIGERKEFVESALSGNFHTVDLMRDFHNLSRGLGYRLRVVIEPIPAAPSPTETKDET